MALITNQEKTTMKHSLFLTILAAAFLGSGVANAATTLYPSQYEDGIIDLYSGDKLVVNVPLTLIGGAGFLDLYNGATIEFQAPSESICRIYTSALRSGPTVYFNTARDVYNIAFDADAQSVVAASAGTPITLIQDLNGASEGFSFYGGISPSDTTLKLNGVESGNPVELGGVQFTYVGPQSSGYTFKAGEIGFTGYENGSHALNLVVGGKPTPEPTTGTLSLLALAGLCIRRRK